MEDYNVYNSEYFIQFIDERNLSEASKKKYYFILNNYTSYMNKTLETLISEADEEEEQNIRLNKRKIRTYLIGFRKYCINRELAKSTIDTNFNCVKTFYKQFGISIPDIPTVSIHNDKDNLDFKDLPDMHAIRTAIEATKSSKHKALFLFAACSGSARTELANFTFGQFLDGLSYYSNGLKTPQDIIDEFDGKCEELELIPVFKMERQKTNYSYYTVITPECTQFMINYLKTALNLKPEDRFFNLTPWGISSAFKSINNKFNWGRRGKYGFFSPHRVRKFNASVIEDTEFGNYIQGRKPNQIKEIYFKKNKETVREGYKKHMAKFVIYSNYDVLINSEQVNELKSELQKKDDEITQLQEQLKTGFEEQDKKIKEVESKISNENFDKQEIYSNILSYCFLHDCSDDTWFINNLYDICIKENNKSKYSKEIIPDIAARVRNYQKLNPEAKINYDKQMEKNINKSKQDIEIKKRNLELMKEIILESDIDISDVTIDQIEILLSNSSKKNGIMDKKSIKEIISEVILNDVYVDYEDII
ncbi:hypothetical protein [Methanobrevibacter sp. UBA417]|jgi:hypothetical protein|uniref:hypothetical protein n=1 Tax=Methanobrevibacter sp. UBA417 TaxID=1915487 RepID=UPI0039B91EF6